MLKRNHVVTVELTGGDLAKLRELAQFWKCSESEAMERALYRAWKDKLRPTARSAELKARSIRLTELAAITLNKLRRDRTKAARRRRKWVNTSLPR